MSKSIYLDYAAATPLDSRVLATMQPYFTDNFYNPSALYGPARKVATDLAATRARLAHWLGVKPAEIIFTAGGTEANNLAINGIMKQYPLANAVVSAIEHEAVHRPALQYDCRTAAVDREGILNLEALEAAVDERTVLISIMYANNEIGTIQPLKRVGELVTAIRNQRQKAGNNYPLYFHTDACQAANYLDLHVSRLGIDLMTLNGGKIYGPKQSGLLWVRGNVSLAAQILGGGQERGLRSGTENVPAIIGLAAALELVQQHRASEADRLRSLQCLAFKLIAAKLPTATINGSLKHRLPNNVHLTLEGQDNERLIMELDNRGILASAGSACTASDDEPSLVLRAIGLSDDQARGSLRLTMGQATTERDIRYTLDIIAELVI